MNNSDKILKVVFFVLLIIVIAELSYFFIYQPKETKITENGQKVNISPTEKPIVNNANQLISQGYLDYLTKLEKKGNNRKIYLEEEMEGTISELSFEEFTREGRLFKGFFIMVNDKNEIIQKFSFTDNRIKFWKFYTIDTKNNEKELMSYQDLKVGQKIKFITRVDLASDPNNEPLINEFIVQ